MKDFEFFKLEDRVLFEAAAAADIVAAADAAQNDPDANAGESERQAQQERNALKNLPPENPAAAMAHPGADDPSDIADVDAQIDALIQGEVGDVESDGRELVVINNSVLDKSAIIDSLKSNQDVLILKDGTGLDEVNAFLDQKGVEYSAIHFVTHGNEGYVSINGEIIDSGNFDAAGWQEIGEHLTQNGDILLYGCNTAATAEGAALIDMISGASGADVAASDDVTGISGDWVLEYRTGEVETGSLQADDFQYNLTTYTVTTADDIVDDTDGVLSLREAVTGANDGDEIIFDSALDGTVIKIDSTQGAISLGGSISIVGNGAENTVIDGQGESGIFEYSNFIYDDVEISISNLTLQNGYRDANSGMPYGGAIYIEASSFTSGHTVSLSLDGVTIAGSQAEYGGGVAVYNWNCDTVLNITNSTFFGNSALGEGGAVYVRGDSFKINVVGSTITGNRDAGAGGHSGGGIYALADVGDSELNVVNSIVYGNYTLNGGNKVMSDIYSASDAAGITVTSRMIHSIYGSAVDGMDLDPVAFANSTGSTKLDSLDAAARIFGVSVDALALNSSNVIEVSNADIAGYSGTLAGYDANGNLLYVNVADGSWLDLDGSAAMPQVGELTDQLGNSRLDVYNYLGIREFFVGAVAGKALIKVVAQDYAEYKYDAATHNVAITYQTASGAQVTAGNKLQLSTTGITSGEDAGTYSFAVKDISASLRYDNADITDKFEISGANNAQDNTKVAEIKITPRRVTFTSGSAQKVYDSTALTNGNVSIGGADGFVAGQGATFNVTGSQTYVGSSSNTFTYTLDSGTKAINYDITVVYGTLTVTQASVALTITSDGAVKFYDGSALTDDGYTLTGSLFANDSLSVTTTGTITNAGSVDNDFTVSITNNGVDVTANYVITKNFGTLTVNKRTVVIVADSDSKTYDGTALTNGGATYSAFDAASGTGFVGSEGFESITVTGSQLNAGSSDNVVSSYTLKDNTLADNYIITTEKGTLTVNQRQITITVDPDQSMTYGDTMADLKYQVGGDGMVSGETLNGSLEITDPAYSSSGNLKAGVYQIGQGTLIGANNPNYKIVSFTGDDFTVSRKEISIADFTVNAKIYDGNTSATLSGANTAGVVSGDMVTVDVSNAVADFASSDAAKGIDVSLTDGLQLTGDDADNYQLPDTYNYSGTGDINPKGVDVVFVTDVPYFYDSTDQSGTVSAYYVDINGNRVELPIDWHGKIFAPVGKYEISVTVTDSNYYALNDSTTLVMLPNNPAGGDYADGVNNIQYASSIHSMQGSLLAKGIGGGEIYNMDYSELVSLSMFNYGGGMMDQQLLINGGNPGNIPVTLQADILEYKPMTLDMPMQESSVFENSWVVNAPGVISGQEVMTPAGDTVIEVRGDAPVESPESLYIDGSPEAEQLPWDVAPGESILTSMELPDGLSFIEAVTGKAESFKSEFEKALEEIALV